MFYPRQDRAADRTGWAAGRASQQSGQAMVFKLFGFAFLAAQVFLRYSTTFFNPFCPCCVFICFYSSQGRAAGRAGRSASRPSQQAGQPSVFLLLFAVQVAFAIQYGVFCCFFLSWSGMQAGRLSRKVFLFRAIVDFGPTVRCFLV